MHWITLSVGYPHSDTSNVHRLCVHFLVQTVPCVVHYILFVAKVLMNTRSHWHRLKLHGSLFSQFFLINQFCVWNTHSSHGSQPYDLRVHYHFGGQPIGKCQLANGGTCEPEQWAMSNTVNTAGWTVWGILLHQTVATMHNTQTKNVNERSCCCACNIFSAATAVSFIAINVCN